MGSAIIIAGACAATFSATTLGLIQVARWANWRQKPDLAPTLTYTALAAILWTGAIQL